MNQATKNTRKVCRFVTLYVGSEYWIVARGYHLYYYNPETEVLTYFSRLVDMKNSLFACCRLTRRAFRAEITHLYHFQNDTWMCIARKALFRLDKQSGLFVKCHNIEKGSRPMNLCQGQNGTIYYGEYCYNPNRHPMRIMQSKDNGTTWQVAYTFREGEVNHIHGIFIDPYISGRLWIATGDDDQACIFGYTDDGFQTLVRKFQGSQQYRICMPLFTKHEIIFATDSQYEQNYIRCIDRHNGEVCNLQAIQGSGIYATQTGSLMMVSTTVEPSKVNCDQQSHLWYSTDGHQWKELTAFKKDIWPKSFFQFGSIRFPHYEGINNYAVFTGRALQQIDGKTVCIVLKNI